MPGFLRSTYGMKDADEVRDHYDRWAASYDEEIAANGYATPARCAAALARHLPDGGAPVLDYGCGTGLSGAALRAVGFAVVDGADVSKGMLAGARAGGAYRHLHAVSVRTPFEGLDLASYAAVACVGVIGAGAAPFSLMDALLDGMRPGALLVLSLNDHALADPQARVRLEGLARAGHSVLEDEDGEHLPGIGLRSRVYVIRRA